MKKLKMLVLTMLLLMTSGLILAQDADVLLDKGDYYLLGGDVKLYKDDTNHQPIISKILSGEPATPQTRGAKPWWVKLWPEGNVYYYFCEIRPLQKWEKQIIRNAMRDIEAVCQVRFIETTWHSPYVKVKLWDSYESGNYSSGASTLGYSIFANIEFNFKKGNSGNTGVAIHELCHTLGLTHEHQRPDRDSYINVNLDNVEFGKKSNFWKASLATTYGPYDFDSIMHYESTTFGINNKVVITTKNPSDQSRIDYFHASLSSGDIDTLQTLYGAIEMQQGVCFKQVMSGLDHYGLYWFRKQAGKRLFNVTRPTIIMIHGFDLSATSDMWKTSKFSGWNHASFAWAKYSSGVACNLPVNAYQIHAQNLYKKLKLIIDNLGYDNKEIRLVGHGTGCHLAAYAAKKLLAYVKSSRRNILVTIDLVDPIVTSGYIKDDAGHWAWGKDHLRSNLLYLTKNQTSGLIWGKKLINLLVDHKYGQPFNWGTTFLKDVLPAVANHVSACKGGNNLNEAFNAYRLCRSGDFEAVRIDSSLNYFRNCSAQIYQKDVRWYSYNAWDHGPIICSFWKDVRHDCWRWVKVRNRYKYWYLKKNTRRRHWWDPHWVWTWKWNYYWVWQLKLYRNSIHCGLKYWPHQAWHHKVWNFI